MFHLKKRHQRQRIHDRNAANLDPIRQRRDARSEHDGPVAVRLGVAQELAVLVVDPVGRVQRDLLSLGEARQPREGLLVVGEEVALAAAPAQAREGAVDGVVDDAALVVGDAEEVLGLQSQGIDADGDGCGVGAVLGKLGPDVLAVVVEAAEVVLHRMCEMSSGM